MTEIALVATFVVCGSLFDVQLVCLCLGW